MSVFFQFDHADAFATGTVGRPGARTFFLQIRSDDHQVTVKCEKQQVAAMAEHLRSLLASMEAPSWTPTPPPLVEPIEAAFVLGPIGLAFDPEAGTFILQLDEMVLEDEEELDTVAGSVRVALQPSQIAAFCEQADTVVAAGRPNCPFCAGPVDPDGHPCPRMN